MVEGITPQGLRFALVHSTSEKATAAYKSLTRRYGECDSASADIIVALGGDGFLLETLGRYGPKGMGVFGMNRGTIGFLLNDFNINHLPERLDQAKLSSCIACVPTH